MLVNAQNLRARRGVPLAELVFEAVPEVAFHGGRTDGFPPSQTAAVDAVQTGRNPVRTAAVPSCGTRAATFAAYGMRTGACGGSFCCCGAASGSAGAAAATSVNAFPASNPASAPVKPSGR